MENLQAFNFTWMDPQRSQRFPDISVSGKHRLPLTNALASPIKKRKFTHNPSSEEDEVPLFEWDIDPVIVECVSFEDTHVFQLDRQRLIDASPFFFACFNGGFKEGIERKVKLFVEPSLFQAFVDWLYTDAFYAISSDEFPLLVPVPLLSQHSDFIEDLVDLYVFADQYDVPKLRGRIFDILVDYFRFEAEIDVLS